MTRTRQKGALIWLAVAAIAVATFARAQAALPNAAAFTNSVAVFLSAHSNSGTSAALGFPRGAEHGSRRQTRGSSHSDHSGMWMALLPIFFVGLVSPLSLISPRSSLSLDRAPAAPVLPFSFQRPPPSLSF